MADLKTPEVGRNYGAIFGFETNGVKQIVYLGGISFRLINGQAEREVSSQDTYDKIVASINTPAIIMGRI